MRRLAIAGGAGFLARALRLRCRDWETVTLDIAALPAADAAPPARHIVGDVGDPAAWRELCRGAEAVFFRQGLLGGAPSAEIGNAARYLAINAEAVMLGLEACAAAGCHRVFLDSSEQVFSAGDVSAQGADDEPTAGNYYGASKLVAEKALRRWALQDARRSAQVFRYPRVRGPETRDVIYHMARACTLGQPIRIIGDPSHAISFVHVDDVIAANLRGLERSPSFAIYNVSCGQPVSLLDLARRIRDIARSAVPIEPVPGPPIAFEPHIAGMRWEASAAALDLQPQRDLDDMIGEALALARAG